MQFQSEFTTPRNTLTAKFEAIIDLRQRALYRVEAMLGTTSALKIHNIELLVQKGVEAYLAVPQSLVKVIEYLLVHVIHSIFAFLAQLEEIP